jgi:hypothetical protein
LPIPSSKTKELMSEEQKIKSIIKHLKMVRHFLVPMLGESSHSMVPMCSDLVRCIRHSTYLY